MRQLQGAGPRNMPWAKRALVCVSGAPSFIFSLVIPFHV
ncbi:hypothetical protein SLEP1_g39985 [Rubroshorea leprosula]|uniref:Uncharacterized protein n=1 Tax=Rubroshorea leprosula TaxID=152421 RepID=A0AAV5L2E7_9ROSI|nr:hypothetical protein SLEP1_g39985 [Rubroshorea leprosula]